MVTVIFEGLVYFWYLLSIVLVIVLYFKSSKPYPSSFKGVMVKEAPDKLNPSLLSFLMYKKIVPEVFTAIIIVLIKRGFIKVIKDQDDYILEHQKINDKLSKSQKLVLDILFNSIAKDSRLKISDIGNYGNSNYGCSDFLLNYQILKKVIYKEIYENNFYETKTLYSYIKFYRIIAFILIVVNFIFKFHFVLGYIIIIPAYMVMIYFSKIYKRTKEANDEYHKWLGYKKYLLTLDANQINKDNLPSYTIQTLILGIARDFFAKVDTDNLFIVKLNSNINRLVFRSILYGNRSINGNKSFE